MIKLSDRLQAIAAFIKPGETVADIGTDHGFLPMSLYEKGISPHVVLCDINEGPLEKAKGNIQEHFPGNSFDLRQGDGLSPLKAGEVDAIVIAGMGGLLISDILGKDIDKTNSYKKFILQPRNGQNKLRDWLYDNHFDIIDETLVKEGKYICEIIVAVPLPIHGGKKDQQEASQIDLEFSPILFANKDPLLEEHINNKIKIEKKIIRDILDGSKGESLEQLSISRERVHLLEDLLGRLLEEDKTMSINFNELVAEIEEIAPRELEEAWDNSGMQINMGNTEVQRVLVTLEITKKVIEEAKNKKIDFIITHHPLMFKQIDVVDYNNITGNYIIDLIKSGISVYSAHTTFDDAFGGNNEYMAELIGLSRIRKLKEKRPLKKEKVIGRMGNFREACTLVEACKIVEEALGIPGQIKAVGDPSKRIKTVGLCTGAGGDAMELAAWNGCDLFITGDIRHHEAQTALEMGLCLIDAGHYGTEHIFAENFAGKLQKNIGSKLEILVSEVNVNPFKSMI